MKNKTKCWCICVLGLGIALIGICLCHYKNGIYEEYLIMSLKSNNDEIKIDAAKHLCNLKSVKAIPKLIEIIKSDNREQANRSKGFFDSETTGSGKIETINLTPIAYCIYKIGPIAEQYYNIKSFNLNTRVNNIFSEIKFAWDNQNIVVYDVDYY
jgi:hypothetical protein